jgi:hypothetical protein
MERTRSNIAAFLREGRNSNIAVKNCSTAAIKTNPVV